MKSLVTPTDWTHPLRSLAIFRGESLPTGTPGHFAGSNPILKQRKQMRTRKLSSNLLAAIFSAVSLTVHAAVVVVPTANTSVEGNNTSVVPFNTGARTNQYQMTNAAMGGLAVGMVITGVEFRLDSGGPASPSAGINWTDYEITLARAVNGIAAMSSTLASNMLNPTLVKDGAFTLAANSLPGTGSPRAFGGTIVFDTPYTYQGGDLVMLLTHNNGTGGTTPTVDGIQTDTAGTGGIRALSTPAGFQATTADNTAFRMPVMQLIYTVPEPASAALLATAAGMLLIRRRES